MGIKERWKRSKPLPEDIKERLLNLATVFKQEEILLVYLFGSLAEGGREEDVDLAVLPGKEDFTRLRGKLVDFLGTERIDLVNLREASPLLRFEIIKNGRLIYKVSDEMENDFELSTLREYKDTAYLRRKQAETLRERTQRWF